MANSGNKKRLDDRDMNRDPLTDEPGAHPVGTGVGTALGGAAAGAAAGLAAGPIGAAAGAVIGGIAGGLAGKAIAENIDPTAEDTYWRSEYSNRPYYDPSLDYERYQPAYQFGWESRGRYADRSWDDVESDLEREWASRRDRNLPWEKASYAARDAWERISGQGSSSTSPKPR